MPKVALHKTIELPERVLGVLSELKTVTVNDFPESSREEVSGLLETNPVLTVSDIAAKAVLSWVQSFLANSEQAAIEKAAAGMQTKLAAAGITLTLEACISAVRNAIPQGEGAES